jgi:hypothetical protein
MDSSTQTSRPASPARANALASTRTRALRDTRPMPSSPEPTFLATPGRAVTAKLATYLLAAPVTGCCATLSASPPRCHGSRPSASTFPWPARATWRCRPRSSSRPRSSRWPGPGSALTQPTQARVRLLALRLGGILFAGWARRPSTPPGSSAPGRSAGATPAGLLAIRAVQFCSWVYQPIPLLAVAALISGPVPMFVVAYGGGPVCRVCNSLPGADGRVSALWPQAVATCAGNGSFGRFASLSPMLYV